MFIAPFFGSVQAQQIFSFESADGFILGNINGQNGWQSTVDGAGLFPTTQTVSNDIASVGTNSLKLVKDPSYAVSPNAFMGAVYNFPTPVSTANMSFSADIYLTEKNATAMSLLFGLVHFDTPGEARYRTYFNLAYDGFSDVLVRGAMPGTIERVDTGFIWQTNTWYTIKIVTQGSAVSYYANGVFLLSKELVTNGTVSQIRFTHDNYNGIAYIDNVKVESTLSSEDFNTSEVTHFYNKNLDQLELNAANDVFSNVSLYNLLGQNVIAKSLNTNQEVVDLSNLSNGVYLVEVGIGSTKKSFKILKN